MTNRLAGKRALVTAAAQGIGAATVRAFSNEGATVVATDINEAQLASLADLPQVATAVLDVTDPAAIAQVIGQHGPFDILFNCAGCVHHGSILDSTEEEWSQGFELNVTSMYRMIRACLPGMLQRQGGSIVNVSSIAGHQGLPNRFVYGTTKAAVIGLTKAVAADFVARNVRCNAICPGTVQTPSLDERINAFDDPVAARAAFISRQPMGRLGKPEEVAALVTYLASDEASFTTGDYFTVDGGMSI